MALEVRKWRNIFGVFMKGKNEKKLKKLIFKYLDKNVHVSEVGIIRYSHGHKVCFTHVCIWEDLHMDFIPYYEDIIRESFGCSKETSCDLLRDYLKGLEMAFKKKNYRLYSYVSGEKEWTSLTRFLGIR